MSNKNIEQDVKRYEWLLDKLRKTEEERDNALENLEQAEIENLSLRSKLSLVEYIFRDEDNSDDLDIPDDKKDIPYAN